MKNKLKNNKGITLVALVVTIVVLLILAGVSINLVIGQNGIVNKAKDAKKNYTLASQDEDKALHDMEDYIIESTGGTLPPIKVAEGTKASKNGTINGKEPTAMNPIIPQGYIPITQGEAIWGDGTTAPTENSVNKGLVITDNLINGNEWVWVPVLNPSKLYVKEAVTITDGGVSETTPNYTKSEILPDKTRGTPNSSSWREPGILNNADVIKAYRTEAGFTTLQNMAENLVNDYNEMIGSLEKYHGFYIGRYELSEQGEKQGGTSGNQSWYTAYKRAKNKIPQEAKGKVETRMIWGLQWDVTCEWIANNGDKKDINNSSSWGNYNSSKMEATGSNENWKANNIYDLAGNCWEWTQEANNAYHRTHRGGCFYYPGSNLPVSYRGSNSPDYSDDSYSSRSTLYVK